MKQRLIRSVALGYAVSAAGTFGSWYRFTEAEVILITVTIEPPVPSEGE
jgi:hypothetical protein